MPADHSIVQLRSVNEKLHALLLQVRQESLGAGTGAGDAFVHLLSEVASAARLSCVFVCCRESVAASEELAKYRRTLQELRQLLPTIQARLLSDRARLEAERAHCSAATAWAETSRRTL
jgi:hypothetical protein